MGMTFQPARRVTARRGCSAVPAQLVEEVVDDVQFAGAGDLVVDVLAHRESSTPRPNGENTTGRSAGTVTRPAITSSRVPSRKSRLPVSCSARASVADAFGTDDRVAVESYCRATAIEFEWQPDGGLRTRQHRSAVVRHPLTGQRCWFNQIAFLNEQTIDPEVREYLVDVFGADGLPFNMLAGGVRPRVPTNPILPGQGTFYMQMIKVS
jgi:hypothetical protein